jgi:thioredoxin 1
MRKEALFRGSLTFDPFSGILSHTILLPTFPMPSPLSDTEFQTKVLKSTTPVLVDFWAPWCGPCKAMHPVIEEVEKQYKGKVSVFQMNVDENSEIPQQFNVMSIPTFIIFKNGEAVDTFVGVRSKEDVSSRLDAVLS